MKLIKYKIVDVLEIPCGQVMNQSGSNVRRAAEHMIWNSVEHGLGLPDRKWYYEVNHSWMWMQ